MLKSSIRDPQKKSECPYDSLDESSPDPADSRKLAHVKANPRQSAKPQILILNSPIFISRKESVADSVIVENKPNINLCRPHKKVTVPNSVNLTNNFRGRLPSLICREDSAVQPRAKAVTCISVKKVYKEHEKLGGLGPNIGSTQKILTETRLRIKQMEKL